MGLARKCDRCGQLFELPKEKELAGFTWLLGAGPTFEPGEVEYGKAYDLCADCTSELSDWMEGKSSQEEEEPKASVEMPEHVNCLCVPDKEEAVTGSSEFSGPFEGGDDADREEVSEAEEEEKAVKEVVTSKPDEAPTITLGRKIAIDYLKNGMKHKAIAEKYGINKKKEENCFYAFRRTCPDEYAELSMEGNG